MNKKVILKDLGLKEYKETWDYQETLFKSIVDAKIKKYKAISEYNNNLKFKSLPNEVVLFEKDTLLKQKRDRWHEDLQKDIYVEETLNVISEMKPIGNAKVLVKKISLN